MSDVQNNESSNESSNESNNAGTEATAGNGTADSNESKTIQNVFFAGTALDNIPEEERDALTKQLEEMFLGKTPEQILEEYQPQLIDFTGDKDAESEGHSVLKFSDLSQDEQDGLRKALEAQGLSPDMISNDGLIRSLEITKPQNLIGFEGFKVSSQLVLGDFGTEAAIEREDALYQLIVANNIQDEIRSYRYKSLVENIKYLGEPLIVGDSLVVDGLEGIVTDQLVYPLQEGRDTVRIENFFESRERDGRVVSITQYLAKDKFDPKNYAPGKVMKSTEQLKTLIDLGLSVVEAAYRLGEEFPQALSIVDFFHSVALFSEFIMKTQSLSLGKPKSDFGTSLIGSDVKLSKTVEDLGKLTKQDDFKSMSAQERAERNDEFLFKVRNLPRDGSIHMLDVLGTQAPVKNNGPRFVTGQKVTLPDGREAEIIQQKLAVYDADGATILNLMVSHNEEGKEIADVVLEFFDVEGFDANLYLAEPA
jgi:hypothetical protein